MWRVLLDALALVGALVFLSAPPLLAGSLDAGRTGLRGQARIVDGDTLRFGSPPIRLHGIDAPEQGQGCARNGGRGSWACGQASADALAKLVRGKTVESRRIGTDRYGRMAAKCSVDERNIGERLVESGLAWVFTRYCDDYVEVEARARAGAVGIWQVDAQPAWAFRAEQPTRAPAQPPQHCAIKGNINRHGERIYHTPSFPAYQKTGINVRRGERWFCSEAEALAAGWRAARGR